MGKSPGKWIKTVLFGKKHSKSNLSKNVTPDKKTAAEDNTPVISDPRQLAENGVENIELEKGISKNSSTVNRDLEPQSNFVSVPLNDDEMRKQCEAITKAQAVFRGYLARRAFRALRGILRLQALIRGHLVRRQAVATLRCMQAVVKLQALARGQRVDIGGNSIFGSGKLATNTYVRKLLLSLPAVMPLSLQYNADDPNSYLNWLKRWSLSRFWDPLSRPRKAPNSDLQSNQSGSTKAPIGDNGPLSSSLKIDNKPKRSVKKSQTEFAQEQAQSELERVKRSLRKVSASLSPASEKLEMKNEKLDTIVSENEIVIPADFGLDPDVTVDINKAEFLEAPMMTDVVANSDDCPLVEARSMENGGKVESARFSHDGELSLKDDEIRKVRKRRSLPEYSENISINAPSLPSYMMATESAKAKLRAQASMAKLIIEDGPEVGYVRRHSLPNGKMNSLSPKVESRVTANNGKVGNGKNNRSMTLSKDDKVLHPGWRR